MNLGVQLDFRVQFSKGKKEVWLPADEDIDPNDLAAFLVFQLSGSYWGSNEGMNTIAAVKVVRKAKAILRVLLGDVTSGMTRLEGLTE